MVSSGGVDCGRIHREKSQNEGCCNALCAIGQPIENPDTPGVWGDLGESQASGQGRDSPHPDLFFY